MRAHFEVVGGAACPSLPSKTTVTIATEEEKAASARSCLTRGVGVSFFSCALLLFRAFISSRVDPPVCVTEGCWKVRQGGTR